MNCSRTGSRALDMDRSDRCARAHSVLLEAECALASCVVAFSDGKPVPTFPENALFVERLAFDGAAAKQPALVLGKIGAGVDRAAVVPHQEITELPDVLVDEVAPLADGVKLLQDRVALLGIDAFDARRHEPVDEQRPASGIGMRDEHGVAMVRDAADVSGNVGFLRALVLVDVERLLAREPLLERGRHRLVGFVHVGEQGVAAGRRQLERVQERVLIGPRRIAGIDVEPELALAEGADRLPVDLDVGDEEDLLVVLLDSLGAAAQRLGRLLAAAEVAEIGREPKLLLLRDGLAAEYQHEMPAPRVLDRPNRLLRKRPGQVDAADLRAAGGRQRRDRHGGRGLDVDNLLHRTDPRWNVGRSAMVGDEPGRQARYSEIVALAPPWSVTELTRTLGRRVSP